MNRLAVFLLLFSQIISFAQPSRATASSMVHEGETKGNPISFHVTSVRQEDLTECDPNKCSSKKFTIEGYADDAHTNNRTVYLLTCTEPYVFKPTPHITMACVRLHADTDYNAKIFSDSINFWPEEKYDPPPYRVLYSIVSETEVSKPRN